MIRKQGYFNQYTANNAVYNNTFDADNLGLAAAYQRVAIRWFYSDILWALYAFLKE